MDFCVKTTSVSAWVAVVNDLGQSLHTLVPTQRTEMENHHLAIQTIALSSFEFWIPKKPRHMTWIASQATSKCCWIQFADHISYSFLLFGLPKINLDKIGIFLSKKKKRKKKIGGLAAWARFIRADLPAVGSSPSRGLGVHAPLGWPGRTCLAQGASWDACTQTPPCIDAS